MQSKIAALHRTAVKTFARCSSALVQDAVTFLSHQAAHNTHMTQVGGSALPGLAPALFPRTYPPVIAVPSPLWCLSACLSVRPGGPRVHHSPGSPRHIPHRVLLSQALPANTGAYTVLQGVCVDILLLCMMCHIAPAASHMRAVRVALFLVSGVPAARCCGGCSDHCGQQGRGREKAGPQCPSPAVSERQPGMHSLPCLLVRLCVGSFCKFASL